MKTQTILKLTLLVLFIGTTLSSSAKIRKGNGNVTKEEREITPFDAVKAQSGINVYLFQGTDEKVYVETDENLQELLIVKVDEGVLRCYIDGSIRRASKLNVYVNFDDIRKIKAESGADIYGETLIKVDYLEIDASSAGDVKIEVEATTIECDASSGADIKVTGITNKFIADASSGADITAKDLQCKIAKVNASSGADISISVSDQINANASSGADIDYYGDPQNVYVEESSGGDVNHH